MKYFFIIVTIFASLLFHWTFGGLFNVSITFLIPVAVLLFWFSRIFFEARLWLAAGLGFFLDNLSPHPFGTHLILFFLLALVAEFVHSFISDRESIAIRGICGAALTILFIVLTPVVTFFLS